MSRQITLRLRADEDADDGIIEGIGGTFGVPYAINGGRSTETLRAGCFRDSFAENDGMVPVYWSHDWKSTGAAPIGEAQLREETDGVHATIQLYIDNDPKAYGIYRNVKARALRELSLGFLTPNQDDIVVRGRNEEIVRADALEVSVVMRGAGNTEIVSTREAPALASASTRSAQPERPVMPPVSTTPNPVLERIINEQMRDAEAVGSAKLRGTSTGERYLSSVTMSDFTGSGFLTPSRTTVTVRSAQEMAERLRIVDDDALRPPGHYEVMEPSKGGRLLQLVNVVPDAGEEIEVAVETDRTEAAAPGTYGAALPEASIEFTSRTALSHRIGCFVTTNRGVLRDRGAFKRVVNRLADDEFGRAVDLEILTGDGEDDRLNGILADDDVTEQPYDGNAESRFQALVRAAISVRSREFAGSLSAVMHPTDALALFTETDDVGASTLRQDVLDHLRLGFVLSSLVPQGTTVLGDYKAGAHLFLRSGLTVATSTQHSDDLVKGRVRVLAEARADLVVIGGAFVAVTEL